MPTIYCLRQEIKSGSKTYPVFIGFLPAETILGIAEAPHFTTHTSNEEIASKLDVPPIKDWQRPLIDEKVHSIAILFSNAGEFMPNPVLLSENVLSDQSSLISAKQQVVSGGIPTMVWEVEIPISTSPNESKPLWILDGQHRIKGLAKSAQSHNYIPVVLLLNQKGNFYDGSDLAKVFAQVTTQATKLDPIHNEWLTYAFELEDYSDLGAKFHEHRDAMQCVAKLCSMPKLGQTTVNNPFLNKVQFNQHYKSGSPDPGGFSYDCIELKKLLFKHYYDAASLARRLPPADLAVQIGLAHDALRKVVQNHNTSVFFGDSQSGSGQKIMQDAYLVGVMSYLLNTGMPTGGWYDVLRSLAFDRTNWNFNWVKSLSGPAQTISRNIALDVFAMIFRDSQLPSGIDNVADYLRGDGAHVSFAFSNLTSNNSPSRKDRVHFELPMGSKKSTTITPRTHLKVSSSTPNIGKVEVTDYHRPLVAYKSIGSKGLYLDATEYTNPLVLTVAMHHYGDTMSSAEFTINW